MADDAQFDPLAGIMTPGVLAGDRQKLFQNQMAQAGQQDGWGYGARAAGLTLGNALGQMAPGPQDRMAAQNQQLLTQPSEVQSSGDSYTDQAAKYDELAKRFLAAGNPQQASKFVQAGQIVRQEGQRSQAEAAKTQMEQAKTTEEKAGAQWVVVDSTPDKYGIPQYKKVGEPISLFNDDGSVNKDFGTQRSKALADAAQSGAGNATVMRVDQFENSKSNSAAIKAQQAIATAGIRATSATDVAGIRAKAASDRQAQQAGLLTDDAKENAYQQYLVNGKMPVGYGKSPVMQAQLANYIADRAKAEGNTAMLVTANAQAVKASGQVLEDFEKGKTNQTIQAINTAVNHMGALDPLIDALGTGDIRLINQAKLAYQKATGQPAPTNYAAVAEMVTGEVSKAALPGGGSAPEREALGAPFEGANSPTALHSAVNQMKTILAGKTIAIKNTWDQATAGRHGDFSRWLTPATQKALGAEFSASPSSGPSTGQNSPPWAPPAATETVPTATGPNGQKLYLRNGQWSPQ